MKFRMEGLVAGRKLTQNKRLEEPTGVGEVPLHRARLRTRLHHHVLWRQRTTKLPGSLANGLVACEQRRCGGGCFSSQAHSLSSEQMANGDVMPGETVKLPKSYRVRVILRRRGLADSLTCRLAIIESSTGVHE